jgi:hypothetical protein
MFTVQCPSYMTRTGLAKPLAVRMACRRISRKSLNDDGSQEVNENFPGRAALESA